MQGECEYGERGWDGLKCASLFRRVLKTAGGNGAGHPRDDRRAVEGDVCLDGDNLKVLGDRL